MFTALYELSVVTIIQVGRLRVVINLRGIMELMWNNGEEAVGGECSWSIPVSQTTVTQTVCHLLKYLRFFPLASARYWLQAFCEVLKEKQTQNYVTGWK